MAINHNKKRNAGMLREFFSKYFADCIVNDREDKIRTAKTIWKKYVHEGTEIYKEMTLSKALLETRFDNREVAHKFMTRIADSAKKINKPALELEKTAFIREINNSIGSDIFKRNIKDYTALASVHVMLSEWVEPGAAEQHALHLEDKVLNFLCESKPLQKTDLFKNDGVAADALVVNIMHQKLNEKYSSMLTSDQKKILQQFVFAKNQEGLEETLKNLREETVSLIEHELTKKVSYNDVKELKKIKTLLTEDYKDLSEINDTNIIFYMTVSKLNDDLKDES